MSADFTLDTKKFDEVLSRYLQVTSRTVDRAINTKAYYIARKASWFTAKASRGAISNEIGSRVGGSRKLSLRPGTRAGNEGAPLAALIIQARRSAKGLKGLYGAEMTKAINELISQRLKSLAFLKSGWLPAIRILAPLADRGGSVPPIDSDARQFGRDQGTATPASKADFNAIAEIVNHAVSLSPTSQRTGFAGFKKYGEQGLAQAFADEMASMEQYIEDHLRPDAEEFNRQAA